MGGRVWPRARHICLQMGKEYRPQLSQDSPWSISELHCWNVQLSSATYLPFQIVHWDYLCGFEGLLNSCSWNNPEHPCPLSKIFN